MNRYRLHAFFSALCVFCSSYVQAEDLLKYKLADYRFEVSSGESKTRVHWSYPVFLGGDSQATNALNVWVRDQSLVALTECSEMSLAELRVRKDSQVQQALARNKKFAECQVIQSVVTPKEAFASYVSFEHNTEWTGLTRPQHGITTLTFDLVRKQKVEMETFFKLGAIEDLNEILAKKISSERPQCQRSFDWSQVSFRPPSTVFIHFAYNASECAACGDGVEVIEDPRVKRLLINSQSHRLTKNLLEIQ